MLKTEAESLHLALDIRRRGAGAADARTRTSAPRFAGRGAYRCFHTVIAECVAITVAEVASGFPDPAGPFAVAAAAAVVVLAVVFLQAEFMAGGATLRIAAATAVRGRAASG